MTNLIAICPKSEKIALLKRFILLKQMCFPVQAELQPSFKFKTKKDFTLLDTLKYGSSVGYPIEPDRIKEYTYLDRQTLRDSCVDFIKAGNQRWYYNTWDLEGAFFSEDGQKKVEVNFNFWMDAQKIWSVPGVKQAMRSILGAFSGDHIPTQDEAQSFFTDAICNKIYQRQPSTQAVKQAIVELMEVFRKTLLNELVRNHVPAISSSKSFQQFLSKNPNNQSRPVQDQVKEYLKKNKNAIYLLGEKFGLIKAGRKALRYQKVRDSVRHPREVLAWLDSPEKVYQDFCSILMIPKTSSYRGRSIANLIDNTEAYDSLQDMAEISDVLSVYEDKTLKKKNDAYWNDLVQKGILDKKEVEHLKKMIKKCNDIAHVNAEINDSKKEVINKGQLSEIAMNVGARHEEKEEEKRFQIQKWLDDVCHSM